MQIVTANRLTDGLTVFRDAAGAWVDDFAAAAVLSKEAAAAALVAAEADVAARLIIGPYAVDVVEVDGRIEPKAQREKIRVTGPTSGSEARAAARAGRAA